ncbi:hypothetical protein D6D10_02448 [Aureobasidium pullulans]|uniref:Uncharacterized protein n=1 Tax=Aureobasidium pullulans TaxID=5580 RepID=A0A4S9F5A6_AURPU|nr:hypothetical protein D6D10_02448 [Aureobasidium pullulans]
MARSSGYRADSPISTSIEVDDYDEHNDYEYDDPKRRISNITATSISSFPDSAWPSDSDVPSPHYSNSKPRPTYRVGSLRRSPLPNERLSPSSLRPPKHTSRRPRSRGEGARPRSRGEDAVHHEAPQETQPAPLVLLHVTVLPPRLPWNRTVLDVVLLSELKHQFGVLRAATSGLISQRGILIAHPREEFELLEESVLEALDLLPERIGYDGQYRPRTPNTVMEGDEDEEEDTEVKTCNTCLRVHIGNTGGWLTRTYAANGLMRAGAWSACWSEMERVDVEVRPCIPEHVCRQLDDVQAAEDNDAERKGHDQSVQPIHEMQTTEAHKQQEKALLPSSPLDTALVITQPRSNQEAQSNPLKTPHEVSTHYNDLPPIYQPKDVPLGLLLRNYLYLILRDRLNLAISFLILTLLVSTSYGMLASQGFKKNSVSMFEGKVEVVSEPLPLSTSSRVDVGHGKRHPMWTGKVEMWDSSKPNELNQASEMPTTGDQGNEDYSFQEIIDRAVRSTTEAPASDISATTALAIPSSPPVLERAISSPDAIEDVSATSPIPALLPLLQGTIDYCPATSL